jgi:hypothetical protein
MWELQKAQHVAALRVKKTTAGMEPLLTVDGELVRSRLFRADEQGTRSRTTLGRLDGGPGARTSAGATYVLPN